MTKQELIESKDEEMNGLIEIHHEQCKELELEIQSLKERLQKAKIDLSNYAYEADRAKRDRDNAERESILLKEKLKQYNQNEV